MGYNSRIKKEVPNRNKIFKQLKKKNTTEEFNDRAGNSIYLNLAKRILFDKPYKNPEYEKERVRMMRKIQTKMQPEAAETKE